MKRNVLFIFIALASCLSLHAQRGVKVTKNNGETKTIFNVDSMSVKNDTVTLWKTVAEHRSETDYNTPVSLPFVNVQKIEPEKKRSIHIEPSSLEIFLGLEHLYVDHDDKDENWINSYAVPANQKLVAKYDDDGSVADVRWTANWPYYITVSPDGLVMGHRPGDTPTVYATTAAGESASVNVNLTYNKGMFDKVDAYDFMGNNGYGRHERYYATDIGVYNKEGNKNSLYDQYNICDKVSTNIGVDGDDIYVGIKFDKSRVNDPKNYITNVIVLYTEAEQKKSPGEKITVDGLNYTIAQSLSTLNDVDLNKGASGKYVYLAYTKDSIGTGEQKYLVNHSPYVYYGGDYDDDYDGGDSREHYTRDYRNCTRMVHSIDRWLKSDYMFLRDAGDGEDQHPLNEVRNNLNVSIDDQPVKGYMVNNDGSIQPPQPIADFQEGLEDDVDSDVTMICTYEPFYPAADQWMSYVDGRTPISKLSIPGTHDSTTADVENAAIDDSGFGYLGRTQRFGFKGQFEMGVRYFDIRINTPSLKLAHGDEYLANCVSARYTYESMLRELWDCVKGSGEFVILEPSFEYKEDDKEGDPSRLRAIENSIVGDENLIRYHPGITLDDCRGKILVLASPYASFSNQAFDASSSGKDDGTGISYYEYYKNKGEKKNYIGNSEGTEITPLWSSSCSEPGCRDTDNAEFVEKGPARKYQRMSNQMWEYSQLPLEKDTWLISDISGFLYDDEDPDDTFIKMGYVVDGIFYAAQAAWINPRIANFVMGLKGKPCGVVRMDFAGTNFANQSQYDDEYGGMTYGHLLCETVIRNNYVGRTYDPVTKTYLDSHYGVIAKSHNRGVAPCPVSDDRKECTWVQLWEKGPKFAECNLGSTIATYIGATQYDQNTVGSYYTFPMYNNKYDEYGDNVSTLWGGSWRTPTDTEMSALTNTENVTLEYFDGETKQYMPGCTFPGLKISGKGDYADNHVFLPFAGEKLADGSLTNENQYGRYYCNYQEPEFGTLPGNLVISTSSSPAVGMLEVVNHENAFTILPVYDETLSNSKFRDEGTASVYYIDNADDLKAFAAFVSGDLYKGKRFSKHPNANAVLTSDIDMKGDALPDIGTISKTSDDSYIGHFDGRGHRILNMKNSGNGLFAYIGNGCIIENVIIDSSCSVTSNRMVTGGLVNCVFLRNDYEKNTVTIRNCGNEANVTSSAENASTGGIIGSCIQLGIKTYYFPSNIDLYITNCYNTGKISNTHEKWAEEAGALCGVTNANTIVTNCWSTTNVSPSTDDALVPRKKSDHFTNTYAIGSKRDWVTNITEDDVKSGKLCYLLNGSTSGKGNGWYQKIGADMKPMPFSAGNDTLYYYKGKLCDGVTEIEKFVNDIYNNTGHEFDKDGICRRLSTTRHYKEPPHHADGTYVLYTPGNLFWFAEKVNAMGGQPVNAILANNIVVDNQTFKDGEPNKDHMIASVSSSWIPIGTEDAPFNGTFEGKGHTIKGLFNRQGEIPYVGFFGVVGPDATIQNLGITDCYFWAKCVGAIMGKGTIGVNNKRFLFNCYSTGVVYGSHDDDVYVGGLAGYIKTMGDLTISNCFSICQLKGSDDDKMGALIGGIEHPVEKKINLSKCFYKDIYNNSSFQCYGTPLSAADMAKGYLCSQLNDTLPKIKWAQNLDIDDAPTFGIKGLCYTRPIANQWNTIRLPFKLKSSTTVQFYTFTRVGQGEKGDTLFINTINEVPADVPCMFKYLGNLPASVSFYSRNEEIKATSKYLDDQYWPIEGVMICAGYEDKENIESKDRFVLIDNKLHSFESGTVTVPAFRASFYTGAFTGLYPGFNVKYVTDEYGETYKIEPTNGTTAD